MYSSDLSFFKLCTEHTCYPSAIPGLEGYCHSLWHLFDEATVSRFAQFNTFVLLMFSWLPGEAFSLLFCKVLWSVTRVSSCVLDALDQILPTSLVTSTYLAELLL